MLRSIQPTAYDNLDILPADISHRNLVLAFEDLSHSKRRLADILEPLQERYALLILDCPPTIGLLADNIFNVADRLLTPLVPTTLSFEAHRQLLAFAREDGHKERLVLGFLSMVDRRKKLHRELAIAAASQFPGMLERGHPLYRPCRTHGHPTRAGAGLRPPLRGGQGLPCAMGRGGRAPLAGSQVGHASSVTYRLAG